jgi:type VI secretion system ImpM family protein
MAEPSERPGLFRRLLGSQSEKVRTARYPLQAYGKLPIYKDFISVGLTDPAAREFRQWIDRGYSYRWAENEAYRETAIPAHGFLLRLPESKACVAGILWGSSDEGGLRKFPFAVFVSFPAGQPASDPFAALHYLTALERQCGEIREGYAAGASLSAFYKAYRGAEFECALPTREQAHRDLKSALAAVTVSELAEALFGASALERWPAFGGELEQAASRVDSAGALRLPLSGALPRSREVGFWLRWLERPEAGRKRGATGLLYSAGRGPGRAVLFLRDLKPEDFLLLHPSERGQPGVLDVGVVEESPGPEKPAETPAARPVEAVPPSPPPPQPPVALTAPSAPAEPVAAEQPAAAPAVPVEPESVPFPEALAGEPLITSPRETFSALVVPAFAAAQETAAPAPPPEPAPAPPPAAEVPTMPAPEPAGSAAPLPVKPIPEPSDWKRRLDAVVGL